MSQVDQVLGMLEGGRWVCGTEFLDERIPRYSARFADLRRAGYTVIRDRCVDPAHHHFNPDSGRSSLQYRWRLAARPDQAGQQALVLGAGR